MTRQNSGFTLTELLIALAIIGILTTVAYPSYRSSVNKTRRSDGVAATLGIQVAQEKFRANCPFYAQNLGASNICGASAAASTVQAAATSREGYYALTILASSATGNAYTVVATAQGSQTSDTTCTPLTITYNTSNPNGLKAPAACW